MRGMRVDPRLPTEVKEALGDRSNRIDSIVGKYIE